jgi:hypothetical protein
MAIGIASKIDLQGWISNAFDIRKSNRSNTKEVAEGINKRMLIE